MSASLLVKLFTEELPPLALRQLGEAFGRGIAGSLQKAGLVDAAAASAARLSSSNLQAAVALGPFRQLLQQLPYRRR